MIKSETHMRRLSGRATAVLVAASLLVSSVAAAETEEPEALIRQGIELRRRGDDARAHGYFKRAYELSKTPRAAAQLGLVDQAVGRFAEADALLAEALASNDPWVQQNRAILEGSVKTVHGHLGEILVVGAPSGTTWSDADHAAAPLRAGGSIWVKPGESTLRFETAAHQVVTKTVKVAAGEHIGLQLDFPSTSTISPAVATATPAAATGPADAQTAGTSGTPSLSQPATPPAAGDDSGRGGRIAGIMVAGAGVALGVTGFLVRNVATGKLDSIQKAAMTGTAYDESTGNWQTYERTGMAMLIGGGVAVVAGAVIYVVNRGKPAESSATQVGLTALPDPRGGGTLQLHARF